MSLRTVERPIVMPASIPVRRAASWAAVALATAGLAWLILSFGPFYASAVAGAILVVLAILKFPWLAALLLVASVPAQEFGALQLAGQSLTLTRAMFPLAVFGFAVSLIVHREPLGGSRILVPFGVFVGLISLSLAWAASMPAAAAEAARWITAFVAFVILVHFLYRPTDRRILVFVTVMALAGVFQATYGVTQSVLALGPESFRVGGQGSRAFGTFGQPNSYAGYLEMVFFPVLWIGMYALSVVPAAFRTYRQTRLNGLSAGQEDRLRLGRSLFLAAFLLISAAVVLSGIVASFSRGAWLGLAAGALVTALLYHRWVRRGALLAVPLVILLAIGGAPTLLPAAVSDRVTTGFADLRPFDAASIPVTDENFAAAERMAHWQAGWRMFEDYPVSGVGAGNFNERYDEYFVREQFQFSRGHAHNFYIHVLAEAGLLALGLYILLIVSVAYLALVVILRSPGGMARMLALGGFGTIVSVGVHNVFENLHVLNLSIQIGAIWALTIAAHRRYLDDARVTAAEISS